VLAVLAQAGEGSTRDSLFAPDQGTVGCGNELNAEEVRALLGASSIDLRHQVTTDGASSLPGQSLVS
jgi:DNA polymerase III gamma/tau subunit